MMGADGPNAQLERDVAELSVDCKIAPQYIRLVGEQAGDSFLSEIAKQRLRRRGEIAMAFKLPEKWPA
jgi:hypothetical protein